MNNKDIQILPDKTTGVSQSVGSDQGLDQMFQHFMTDPFGSWLSDFPTIARNNLGNIKETDEAYLLAADIPGIPKEDIKIHVDGNLLTVAAENDKVEGDQHSDSMYRREYHSFRQVFTLPSNVDADKIEAHCENGVLEVLMPKTTSSTKRNVEIQSGQGGFWNRLKEKVSGAAGELREPEKH